MARDEKGEGVPEKGRKEPLEIEVKFRLVDRSRMEARIERAGGVRIAEVFETNVRWDDASGSLRAGNRLLRLRKEVPGRWVLTYKRPPEAPDPRFKMYEELETDVGDGEEMAAILEALGFRAVQVYEKVRLTYRLGTVTLCLDRLPFGDFLEIEGEKEAILETAGRLGLDWEERILDNYLALFEKIRLAKHLQFSDVTFANFDAIREDSG